MEILLGSCGGGGGEGAGDRGDGGGGDSRGEYGGVLVNLTQF